MRTGQELPSPTVFMHGFLWDGVGGMKHVSGGRAGMAGFKNVKKEKGNPKMVALGIFKGDVHRGGCIRDMAAIQKEPRKRS